MTGLLLGDKNDMNGLAGKTLFLLTEFVVSLKTLFLLNEIRVERRRLKKNRELQRGGSTQNQQ